MVKHKRTKMGIRALGWLTVLILAGTVCHGAGRPVVKKLSVLGSAVVHENDLVAGRQNAVNDALVAAVGQVVVEMLTGESVVRRFKLINDGILAQPEKYIQNYRVLTESVAGKAIRTLVRVDIAVERVSRDLTRMGVALAGAVYPRVVFMVAEKKEAAAEFVYWWGERDLSQRTICEAAMAETLQAIGFDIIDPPVFDNPLGLPRMAPQNQMMALAQRLGADILIAGSGTAAAASNTMGGSIAAFEAVVDVRAFSVQSGQQVGRTRQNNVVSSQDAFAGGREALSGAGARAGDDLARQIMIAWQQEQDRRAVIQVVVEGTGGHIASFVRLRTAIATLSGVKELKMQEMSTDQAIMAVSYQGSARSLADALLLKTFAGFGIDIHEVTSREIRIRLVHQ